MMESSSSAGGGRPGFYQDDGRFGIGLSSTPTTTAASNSQVSFPSSSYYTHQTTPAQRGSAPSSRDVEFMRYYSGGGGGGPSYAASQLPPEHLLMLRSSSSPSTSHSQSYSHNPVSNSDNQDSDQVGPSGSAGGGGGMAVVEREHMFDKVVTPSDVGKLNRLVIPKQHAEKYFPLDSSTNEKGLLLNFEDRNGKPWRFRYSYWNSSQSYVMTKGWSRFVKEKKLDAGDIVSFQRGLGCKDRLFIDWRRRPDYAATVAPSPTHPFPLPPLPRLYHHPSIITTPSFNHSFTNPQQFAFQYPTSWNHHYQHQHHPYYLQHQPPFSSQNNSFTNHFQHELSSSRASYGNPIIYLGRPPGSRVGGGSGSGSDQLIRGMTIRGEEEEDEDEEEGDGGGGGRVAMVYESVPVVQGKATAKRLRLFGVNMDCPIPTAMEEQESDRYASHHHNYPEILAPPLSSSAANSTTTASLMASHFSSSNSPLMIRPYIDSIDAVSDNNDSTNNGIPIEASQTMPRSSSRSSKGKAAAASSSSMSLDLDI